jgi:phosphonopyruvate decarboxylase
MIPAQSFVDATRAHGFALWTGVPCSYLKPFINYVIDAEGLTYISAANEGDAVGIAAGAELAGKPSIVMFQNSGFGNTVNPITSLNMIFKIPVLVITTLRGEPGGPHDEPQHDLMGQITTGLFELMRVPWEYFPTEEAEIAPVLERAVRHMRTHRTPYGLVMKKDSVADHKLRSKAAPKPLTPYAVEGWHAAGPLPSRRDVLSAVQRAARPTDALIATTGFTGRCLYALDDRPSQLYMVGSMGCASSFGLGLAWAEPARRTIVLDGDGAVLMRMGALTTVGYERPENLLHIVLDNEVHDSTGSQSTVTHSVDLAAVAAASGYPRVVRAHSAADVEAIVREGTRELTFVHVKTAPGESGSLPRPKETPVEVYDRMQRWLRETRP